VTVAINATTMAVAARGAPTKFLPRESIVIEAIGIGLPDATPTCDFLTQPVIRMTHCNTISGLSVTHDSLRQRYMTDSNHRQMKKLDRLLNVDRGA
jgi:hypothetical protein